MNTILYKSETRGKFQNEWLNTHYSFSFADYFDKDRLNFGALRVLNDDIIQPSRGFGKHPHDNMEIITIPLSGKLSHLDSMGHEVSIGENEVQVMTAGTGIFHSEYNASKNEEAKLLQIWIYPSSRNFKPDYSQKLFNSTEAQNTWQELVSGDYSNNSILHINQNAKISRLYLSKNKSIEYHISDNSYGCFVFLINGEINIAGENINKRDAIGIYNSEKFDIMAVHDSFLINIEVPER